MSQQPHLLFTQTHFDIAGGTDISTNFTTNTAAVVGFNITAERLLIFIHPEDSILRAIDNTAVTFKTHATTHTAIAFCLGLFLGQIFNALSKISEDLFFADMNFRALITRFILKMAEEQFLMRNDLSSRTVFIIMNGKIIIRSSPCRRVSKGFGF